MITMKKSEDGNEFLMADGDNILGSCRFDIAKKEIISFDIKESHDFVLINLTKAVLNSFDLAGVKTVKYFGDEDKELLKKQGFTEENDCLSVNLEGYFDCKCCKQENK